MLRLIEASLSSFNSSFWNYEHFELGLCPLEAISFTLNHLVVFNVPEESGLRSASQGSTSEDKVLIVGVVTPPVIIPVIPVVGGVHAAHLIVLVIHDVIGAPVVGIDLKLCLIRLK